MFKVEGTAIEVSPRKIDWDTLEFATEYEAKEWLINSVLPPDFIFKNKKYYLDKDLTADDDYYFEIIGEREWSADSFNPCKSESGEVGEKVYNFFDMLHTKWKQLVSPKIKCQCCKEINYRFMKYGIMLATIPLLPSFLTLAGGFILVIIALVTRLIL